MYGPLYVWLELNQRVCMGPVPKGHASALHSAGELLRWMKENEVSGTAIFAQQLNRAFAFFSQGGAVPEGILADSVWIRAMVKILGMNSELIPMTQAMLESMHFRDSLTDVDLRAAGKGKQPQGKAWFMTRGESLAVHLPTEMIDLQGKPLSGAFLEPKWAEGSLGSVEKKNERTWLFTSYRAGYVMMDAWGSPYWHEALQKDSQNTYVDWLCLPLWSGDLEHALEHCLQGTPWGFSESLRQQIHIAKEMGTGRWIPLAHGKTPKPPRNESLVIAEAFLPRQIKWAQADKIDFREISPFFEVNGNDLIATRFLPLWGEPGIDLDGKPLAVTEPQRIDFSPGAGIEKIAVDEGTVEYRAGIEGVLYISPTGAHIEPFLKLGGDVGIETGHIRTRYPVSVQGELRSGFLIDTPADVELFQTPEGGAMIRAGGNLTVHGGLVGEQTRVMIQGNVDVRFAEDVRIEAGGAVRIQDYALNARVFAGTTVQVEGSGRDGTHAAVIGSMINGPHGIWIESCEGGAHATHLISGVNMVRESIRNDLNQRIQQLAAKITELQKSSASELAIRPLSHSLKSLRTHWIEAEKSDEADQPKLEQAQITIKSRLGAGSEVQIQSMFRKYDQDRPLKMPLGFQTLRSRLAEIPDPDARKAPAWPPLLENEAPKIEGPE